MSERTFCNIRYALPGFSFVIAFLLCSPYLVLTKISAEVLSLYDVSIGVSSIIGISSLGVLTSQVWHNLFNTLLREKMEGESFSYMSKMSYSKSEKIKNIKYQIKNVKKVDYVDKLMIRDYILFYLMLKRDVNNGKPSQCIRDYLSRRWDLLTTIGAGYVSYILGGFLGAVINSIFFRNSIQIDTRYYLY